MIREIDSKSIKHIKELFLDVFTNEPWNDEWESDSQALFYIEDLICNRNSLTFGLYEEDELIGVSMGYVYNWWQGKEYYIKEFCISRSKQSKGYGKKFLSEIEEYLRNKDISTIWLTTEKTVAAYNFYINNGFNEFEESVFLAKGIKW